MLIFISRQLILNICKTLKKVFLISPPTPSPLAVNAVFVFKKWGKMCEGSVCEEKNNFAELLFIFASSLLSSRGNCLFEHAWRHLIVFRVVIVAPKFTSSILFCDIFLMNHQLQTVWKQLWALTMGLRQKGSPPRY